jgi:hypothetical protein
MRWRNSVNTIRNEYGTVETFTVGNWYRIGVRWDNSGNVAQCMVDSDNDGSWDETLVDDGDIYDYDVERIYVGMGSSIGSSLGNNEQTILEFDNLGVDDDAFPGVCN